MIRNTPRVRSLLVGALGVVRTAATLAPVNVGSASPIPGLIGGAAAGAPAVIVIQEWWGITDTIKAHAEKIAEEGGFRVFVPDVYKGKLGVNVEEANHLMSNLDFPAAVKEISEAAAYLKAEGAPAVGVTGFCMGGALAMGSLAASPDLTCGAPFYGVNTGLFDFAQLASKPVQGHFGEEDNLVGFSDAATGRALEASLRAAGNADATVHIYPKVGHAFMNHVPAPFPSFEARQDEQGFPPFDAETVELAWSRLLTFFGKHLKTAGQQKQEL